MFGLDGVLLDYQKILKESFNETLKEYGYPTLTDSKRYYFDNLPIEGQLQILNVDPEEIPKMKIWHDSLVMMRMKSIEKDHELIKVFRSLQEEGYKVAVCSNAMSRTVHPIITELGLSEYIDMIRTVDDVSNPKPHPETWWDVMSDLGVFPEDCIIIENSKRGLDSAYHSGVPVKQVQSVYSPEDIPRLIHLWVNPEAKAYRNEVLRN
jgi:HAD superfamily hydrolase (TIGR01509 family)